MVGASLLWVGWFGFNAGSALEANGVAALAFVNTWWPPLPRPVLAVGRMDHQGQAVGWVPRPVPWPAWWRSPRRPASSVWWAPS
jgi:hypothetical protein